MSTLTITVAGSAVVIQENSLKITSRVDDKDKAVFAIRDDSGVLTFQKGQTVRISDSSLGVLFSGYINKPTCTNLFPSATNIWSVDCVNHFYVAAKKATSQPASGRRRRGGKHKNQHAGPIAALQIQEYLAPSGVSGNFGLDWTELTSDWQAGTLSGTAATTNASTDNVGAGDLEIAPAGASMTHTESVTTDFATGTLSSVVASNNSLTLNGRQGIQITGTCTAQAANCYIYYKVWGGSYSIVSGDSLQYSMWINGASTEIKAGVDGICSDGTTIRDFNSQAITDQNGFAAHPNTNLKGWADNQWYSRQIDLTSLAGKTLNAATLSLGADLQGANTAYFYNVVVMNGATIKQIIYNGGTLNASAQVQNVGYKDFAITTPVVYDKSGYRNSSTTSIASVGCISNSAVSWTVNTPTGTAASLNTSFDGGATWQAATNQSAIPGLFVGDNTSAISVATQELLSITGSDPTITPTFSSISWTVVPALSTTKTDSLTTYNSSANFNSGTLTNTQILTSQATNTPIFQQNGAPQAVVLNGAWRNWQDSSLANQSVFGASSPTQTSLQGQLVLGCASGGNDVRSQFVFAGQWANFTASIDVLIPGTTNEDVGLVYRTTNWSSGNYTFAYSAHLFSNKVNLIHGTNTSSGSNTVILSVNHLDLQVGTWHTLTVVANGTNHQVYVDGVKYIDVTDATFTAAGYLGARAKNGDSSSHSYYFDNFGVVASLSGTWLSTSIPLNSVVTAGSSIVQWDQATLPAGTSITAQASLDGGSTYQSVGNGGAIPQIPAGTSLVGKSLLLLFTLISGSASTSPALNSVSVDVAALYSASGTRTNAPLAADTAYRLPVGSGFGTSTTGLTYTQTGTGTTNLTGNELQIINTTGDVHMVAGSTTGTDEDGTVRFSLSASTISAGLELRYGSSGFYRLAVSTTTLTLLKKSGALSVTLATASVSLSTATFYYLRFRVTGSAPVLLYGRVWQAGTIEQATWNITGTD